MHGCEAGANRGKGGERESVHVELFFQSRVQVCLKNLGFLDGARALLFILPFPLSLSLLNELKKRGKTWTTSWTLLFRRIVQTSEKRKKENAIEGRLDEERRIKISMKDTWFVSHDYETAKVNNSRLESYGWGIHQRGGNISKRFSRIRAHPFRPFFSRAQCSMERKTFPFQSGKAKDYWRTHARIPEPTGKSGRKRFTPTRVYTFSLVDSLFYSKSNEDLIFGA